MRSKGICKRGDEIGKCEAISDWVMGEIARCNEWTIKGGGMNKLKREKEEEMSRKEGQLGFMMKIRQGEKSGLVEKIVDEIKGKFKKLW